jgi:thiol-disulfide isomerase/thioredoxin
MPRSLPLPSLLTCLAVLACVPQPGDADDDVADAADAESEDAADTSGQTGETGDEPCVGVTPLTDPPAEPCAECAPAWRLEDVQPRSCGFGQTYGLDSFEGHVTLVALLAGWCSYCQGQTLALEQLKLELALEGYDVEMVTINGTTANNADDQQELIDRCSFPIFQDLDEVGAWDLHGGGKDDMYIYAADGTLAQALPVEGELSTNLSTDEGYANVKQALIEAFE